jgi:hypothetical protein
LAKAVATHWSSESDDDHPISNRSASHVAREIERVIASSTAVRWLKKLGFKYKEYRKGIYNDGHEREDVKRYRNEEFLPRMESYKGQLMEWDEDLDIIPNPLHLSGEVQPLILVTQDESTFNANDGRHFIWVHEQHKPLRKKGRGQGLHVSDFLTPIGRLGDGDAAVILKCGGDVWWNGERLIDQIVNKAIPAFEAQFPGCKALFAFDNARNHLKFADNALRVSEMNLEPGGKNRKPMHDTFVIDPTHANGGFMQSMTFPNGVPKGLKAVLTERGLWPQNCPRFLAQCSIKSSKGKGSRLNPRCLDGGECCARALLAAQPDFKSQKSQVEEVIKAAGHEVIFYPAFHCEINFIEYYWGAAKVYTRNNCEYDFEALKRLVPEALAQVPKKLIWKYWARTDRIMEAYRQNIVYGTPEYERLVSRRYRSHRRVQNMSNN